MKHRCESFRMLAIVGWLALFCAVAYSQLAPNRQLTQPEPVRNVSERRIALVIGNASYKHAAELNNTVNDAKDMAAALQEMGFELIDNRAHLDQSAEDTKKLIIRFGERLRQSGGVGLFYYAGHGVQVSGRNYLIPVEVQNLTEQTIEFVAVDTARVLAEMDAAGNGFNIVILDACRSNPFARSWRSAESGLAPIGAPAGTLIAYATSPGRIANDGTGRNGLYTSQLLRLIRQPGLTVLDFFQEVRASVKALSKGTQVPWEATSLTGKFYFNRTLANPTVVADRGVAEDRFWDSIKSSTDPEDFRAYLTEYPNGRFVSLARNGLKRSEALKSTSVPTMQGNIGQNSISMDRTQRSRALKDSGDAHRMKFENEAAINDFTESIRVNPRNDRAYALRALTYQQIGKFDLALIDITAAIQLDANDPWYFHIRGDFYNAKREFNLALNDFNEAIRLSPTYYSAYERRGAVYRQLGRNDLADADQQRQINDLSEAIRLKPNDASAFLDRCDAFRMKSDLERALNDCNQAIRVSPSNARAYAMRGNVYQMKGDKDSSLNDLTHSIQLDPTYWWSYERRAEVYRSLGLIKLAESDAQKARELKAKY